MPGLRHPGLDVPEAHGAKLLVLSAVRLIEPAPAQRSQVRRWALALPGDIRLDLDAIPMDHTRKGDVLVDEGRYLLLLRHLTHKVPSSSASPEDPV